MAEMSPESSTPEQEELPLAVVRGIAVTELPKDLYIPPDALEVFLDAFEGPLDLLLYLIRRQNLNILDIPVAEITQQYVQYIDLMQDMRLELAGEYLLMAAMLMEIKSRMMLPRPISDDDDETDPRAELVRRLQEYERFKQAAEDIDALPQVGRDVHPVSAHPPELKLIKSPPKVELSDILSAFKDVMNRVQLYSSHQVELEPLSVRERMTDVLSRVRNGEFVEFVSLFKVEEGRMGVVVSLLAILELVKESLLDLVQEEAYGNIFVRAAEAKTVEAVSFTYTEDP
ncbi:MAG TPA: segregation/condensation protein A [Chromatiaceae bacterium]|jgi:segregation and condensation protein A|nr:segregation/condensation protein A [Chromatiaceae bacterium]HIA07527.1 segregation/condensation protein A [Chromatiaceae bacterium]HIN83154.1 segregation/condensation protein A [Chromatiales bacterium]HIO55290.1 segregation/condensation protein A [Chromatiales bacterium]